MAIWTLTEEKANKLLQDVKDKEQEIDILTRKSPKDLWSADLDEFIAQWHHQLEEDKRLEQTIVKKKGGKVIKTRVSRKKKGQDDSDDEYGATPAGKRKKASPKKQSTLQFKPAETKKKRTASQKPPLLIEDEDELDEDDFDVIESNAKGGLSKDVKKPKVDKPQKETSYGVSDSDLEMLSETRPKKESIAEIDMSSAADEESPSSEEDDSAIAPVPASKTGFSKKGVSKPTPKKRATSEASSMHGYEDDDNVNIKPKSRRAAATKQPIIEESSDELDALGDLSLMAKGIGDESVASSRRLFATSSKPVRKATATNKKGSPKKATKLFDLTDAEEELSAKTSKSNPAFDIPDNSEDDFKLPEPKKAAPAKKVAPAKKAAPAKKPAPKGRSKKTVESSDDDIDVNEMANHLLSDGDSDIIEIAAPVKSKPKAAAPKKKAPLNESPPPVQTRVPRGRIAVKPVYKYDESEDEGGSSQDGDSEDYDEDDD